MSHIGHADRQIILATHNRAKLEMFGQVLAGYGLDPIGLDQLEEVPGVEENADTPEANALLKARAAWAAGRVVFADDAGMEVDALNGEPGVQTRRWNGRFSDTVDDQTWLNYLLARLEGVPLPRRTARFVSGWALIGPDGRSDTKRIITPFLIAEKPIFPLQPGFPMAAVHIRLSETEPTGELLVRRELDGWEFFRKLNFGDGSNWSISIH